MSLPPKAILGPILWRTLINLSRAEISFPQNLVVKNRVRPFRFAKIIAIARCLCFEKYCVLHGLCRPKKQPVSKPTKTFHQISVYWLCQHKRQTYISAVYERITKGQLKRCIGPRQYPPFWQECIKILLSRSDQVKENGKTDVFHQKKIFPYLINFPSLSKDNNNLKRD